MPIKVSAPLTAEQRAQIHPKNFAVKLKGGVKKYPIPDEKHARLALSMVRMHGSPEDKRRVYAAVAKKYPALATRSTVVPEKKKHQAAKKLGLKPGEVSYAKEGPIQKIAGDGTVSEEDARRAYVKLQNLKNNSLTGGELARGAITGALVGPVASLASSIPKMPQYYREGGWKGLAANLGTGLLGSSLSGAVLGAGLPSIRRKLDERAQIGKLEDYLNSNEGSNRFRRKVKRNLGL